MMVKSWFYFIHVFSVGIPCQESCLNHTISSPHDRITSFLAAFFSLIN